MLKRTLAFLVIMMPLGAHAQMNAMLSPECKVLTENMNRLESSIRDFYQGDKTKNMVPPLHDIFQQSYQEIGVHNALALQYQKLNIAILEMKNTLSPSDASQAIFVDWDAIQENIGRNCGDLNKLEPFQRALKG